MGPSWKKETKGFVWASPASLVEVWICVWLVRADHVLRRDWIRMLVVREESCKGWNRHVSFLILLGGNIVLLFYSPPTNRTYETFAVQ